MRRWTHPLYHLLFHPVWLSSLTPPSTGLSPSYCCQTITLCLYTRLQYADVMICCSSRYWKQKDSQHFFRLPQWGTRVSLKVKSHLSLTTHTHTHSVIPLSPFLHKPLLFSTHYYTSFLSFPPSAMQQLFIDSNDQWERVLWEPSHPGARGTQQQTSQPEPS